MSTDLVSLTSFDPKTAALIADIRALGGDPLPNGLVLPNDITPEQFEAMAFKIGMWHEAIKWWIGDLEFQGEAVFGEAVYQYLETLNISNESKRQYLRVAGDVPLQRRRTELSWSHHRAVAPLAPDDQIEWLQRAVESRWTKQELEAQIKEWRGIPEKPRRPYVMEQVCDAAQHIWDAVPSEDEEIPDWLRPPLEELADALGVVD